MVMATLGNSWAGLYRVQPSVTTRPTNPSHYQVKNHTKTSVRMFIAAWLITTPKPVIPIVPHPYTRKVIKSHKSPDKSHMPVAKGKKPRLEFTYCITQFTWHSEKAKFLQRGSKNKWLLGTPGKRKSWQGKPRALHWHSETSFLLLSG